MDLSVFTENASRNISQYCHPFNYELAGKHFIFAMDDGIDYHLRVIDKQLLEWNFDGDAPKAAEYMCQKGDNTTYLVYYQLAGEEPRKSHTFVIDLENMLTTRLIAEIGNNPVYPYLVQTFFEFGAIREEGKPLPFKRHGYTSDMIGNVIKWTYSSEMSTIHVYYCADYYRITYPPGGATNGQATTSDILNAALKELPSADEPTVYIKIKDGLYFFSLTEVNMEKHLGDRMPYRSNTMCFLENYKSLYMVGRSFGTKTIDGVDGETSLMFAAYGQFVEVDPSFLTDPNPYLT